MTELLPEVLCVSLGMVIIDDIRMPNRPPIKDVLGGSASFVTLGQRLFADDASKVGCLIIADDDFPLVITEGMRSWGATMVMNTRNGQQSTRGLLEYEDDTFGPKTFKYTAGPLRAAPADLVGTPLLHAKAFHFFGKPEDILEQIPELLRLRQNEGSKERPFIVWEPLPAVCNPQNRKSSLEACKLVDVFSPNHIEMSNIFEEKSANSSETEGLERCCQAILDSSIGLNGYGAVIVRAGERGSLSASRNSRPTWLPAYYSKDTIKIIDPTGAGNTFLGGYIAGWQRTGDIQEAVYHGHVAASFALEQIGLPTYEKHGIDELWNGVKVSHRLEEYRRRLGQADVRSERVL